MATLYPDALLCSDCFVQLLYARVTSPFLQDSDHADWLVDQLQDVADVCSTSIPDITTRAVVTWDAAPAPTYAANFTTTTTTGAAAGTTGCSGQVVSAGAGCDALAKQYGLSTGELQGVTGSATCVVNGQTCFRAACGLLQVGGSGNLTW
jgi:hypothetical protein